MSNVQIHQSVTGFAAEKNSKVVDYLNQKLSTKGDTGAIKVAVKFTASILVSTVGSVFHAVFTVASLVEAVARHVLALTFKTATFVIPAGISQWIDNKVVTPLFKHGQMTLETAPRSAARIVTNFLSEETRISADTKVSLGRIYNSNLFKNFYRLHWTGLSKKSQKVETQSQERAPKAPAADLRGRVQVEEKPKAKPTESTEETPATQPSIFKTFQENAKWAWNNPKEVGKALIGPTARKVYLGVGVAAVALVCSKTAYNYFTNPMIPNTIVGNHTVGTVSNSQPSITGYKTGHEPIASHQYGQMYTAQKNEGFFAKLNPFAKTEQLPDITPMINKTALEEINRAANAQKSTALAQPGFFTTSWEVVKENPVETTIGGIIIGGLAWMVRRAVS